MLLKKIPSIEIRSEKITGITFSVLNILFFLRLIWQLFLIVPDRGTIIIICGILLIQILLIILGFQKILFPYILRILHLSGSPFIIFAAFIFLKRLLKPIIADQLLSIRTEIGTWYLAIFIFLAIVILINFIRDLLSRATAAIPGSTGHPSQSKFMEITHYAVILILIGYWIYTQAIDPLPIYSHYDPEFSYMLNSLTPFKDLELYGRMDHPGTFLQIAGSMIALLLSPISMVNDGYPYIYHIKDPEAFIYSARFLILLLNIFTVRIIYKYFQNPKTWTEAIAGTGALVVYFSTHTYSFTHLTNWSPNSFNFAVGTFILIILFIVIKSGKYKDLRTLWMVSVAFGLAATFQIYMVTLILCAGSAVFLTSVFERNHWSDTLKFTAISAIGAVGGYITGTLVILQHYGSFIRWIGNVITHQGSYGSGTPGFVTTSKYFENIFFLWNENPALFIFWFISILVFLLILLFQIKKKDLSAPIWAFIIGINIQIIFLFILFGKQPGHRYLLSISSVFPLIVISIAGLLDNKSRLNTVLFSSTAAGLVALLVFNFSSSISNHIQLSNYHDEYQKEIDSFRYSQLQESGFDSENAKYHWTYDTLSPCYSLWLGNDFSKSSFTDEILDICPDDLQYDIWKYPLNELGNLKENGNLNILIVNNRNFKMVDDSKFITKVKSSLRNLGFIIVHD